MSTPETQERPEGAVAKECPTCASPLAQDQLFCLECGTRVGLAYRRPPSWRLPAAVVGGVVLLAGAGLAIALAELSDDAGEVASAPAPTQQVTTPAAPGPPAGAGTGEETAPAEEDAEGEPEEPPAPDSGAGADGEIAEWPADTSAYTVILLSGETRAAARARAGEAVAAGVPAGVLRSDDYSSLNPGFWVVFGGEFDTQEEAQQEAERYASLGFPGGYARFVNGGD